MFWEAERPLVYAGGGIIAAKRSQRTARVRGSHRCSGGLHADGTRRPARLASRTSSACRACTAAMRPTWRMYNTDLLIALGVRFDDRVTGRLAAFAPHARVIHVDIDPAEIGKNRHADIPIVGDCQARSAETEQSCCRAEAGDGGQESRCRARAGGGRSASGRPSIRSTRRDPTRRSNRSI